MVERQLEQQIKKDPEVAKLPLDATDKSAIVTRVLNEMRRGWPLKGDEALKVSFLDAARAEGYEIPKKAMDHLEQAIEIIVNYGDEGGEDERRDNPAGRGHWSAEDLARPLDWRLIDEDDSYRFVKDREYGGVRVGEHLTLPGEPETFGEWSDGVAAARRHGYNVTEDGVLVPVGGR
jgi:hypothetical protein